MTPGHRSQPASAAARASQKSENRRIASTYDAAADHFDDAALGFWRRIGGETVRRIGLRPGDAVLDVGCGSGWASLEAARAVGPTGRVIGVDLSGKLLELGRAKAAADGLENLEFRCADMTASRFDDESFDAVISVFSAFFAPDMAALILELRRMLRPGGASAMTTWGPGAMSPMMDVWTEAVRKEDASLVESPMKSDRLSSPDAVRSLLDEFEWDRIEIELEASSQALRGPEDWWVIALGTGRRWAIDQLDDAARRRARDECDRFIRKRGVVAVKTDAIFTRARKP